MAEPTVDNLVDRPDLSPAERETLRRLLRRRRSTPLTRLARELLSDAAPTIEPGDWAGRLASWTAAGPGARWEHRWLACWALGRVALPDEQLPAAVAALDRVVAERAARREPIAGAIFLRGVSRALRLGIMVAMCLWIAAMVLANVTSRSAGTHVLVEAMTGATFMAGFCAVVTTILASPVVLAVSAAEDTRVREVAARSLARIGTIDCIPALAYGALGPHAGTRAVCIEALHHILFEMPPVPAAERSEDLSRALAELICHLDNALVMDALNAIEKAGGGSCLTQVGLCAEQGRTEAIRKRAADLLPLLRERRAQERQAARLLRPAEPDAASTLLRAAPSSPTDPELLLRPAESDDQG